MSTAPLTTLDTDTDLWQQAQSGNVAAFEAIVLRHQSMVCAVAYGACGDLQMSEDVAQETFWAAWRERAMLEDPSRLRAWLCGIARNLGNNARRKAARTATTLNSAADVTSTGPGPADSAVSNEEQSIVWRALEQIPESYREPLILFYRERHSVTDVAQALGLSEDAAKQRLSRGRGMLRERVAEVVDGALRRSRPGQAFTVAVMAGLTTISTGAKAAFGMAVSAGSKAALAEVGGAALKAGGLTLNAGIVGGILGPVLGLFGGWLGTWLPAQLAPTKREREYLLRVSKRMLIVSILFTLVLFAFTALLATGLMVGPYIFLWAVWMISYGTYITVEAVRFTRAVRNMRTEPMPADEPNDSCMRARFTAFASRYRGRVYRSQMALFGWPLIDINVGDPLPPGESCAVVEPRTPRVARGWIAVGDEAHGILLAMGGVARGLIAVGGKSLGVLSLGGCATGIVAIGGLAIGIVSFGGLGLGVWALGGAAIGWQAAGGAVMAWDVAAGGIAVSWHAAFGGAAIAHDFAVGAGAWAEHINDQAAKAVLLDHPIVQGMDWYNANLAFCLIGIAALSLLPLATWPLMYRKVLSK